MTIAPNTQRVRTVLPNGEVTLPPVTTDPSATARYIEDASRLPGGRTSGVYRPKAEGEVVAIVRKHAREGSPLLAVGAQSSLTGGSTPFGEFILSFEEMTRILSVDALRRTTICEPGVVLADMQRLLAEKNLYYPPVPTYDLATVGGSISTNAAGSATFKYGVTRDWVERLRVVIHPGEVLEIRKGDHPTSPNGIFEIERSDGSVVTIRVPTYSMPPIKKQSAGYYAAPGMDLIDLFIGAEGTLGIVTEVELRLIPRPTAMLAGVVFLSDETSALNLTTALRQAAMDCWDRRNPTAPDVRAIEYLDRRSIKLLRDRRVEVPTLKLPEEGVAIWFEQELPEAITDDEILRRLEAVWAEEPSQTPDPTSGAPDPVTALLRLLHSRNLLEGLELALPSDGRRRQIFRDFREAVPKAVSEILKEYQRTYDPAISKVGADMAVPFEKLPEMVQHYDQGFRSRGIDYAIWGHMSDGNLHPNALPKSRAQMAAAKEAILEFGVHALRLGGSPMSEHGVGRNPIKQELMRRFRGDQGIEEMRAVKRVLDPAGIFAPGVLFPSDRPRAA